jgi:hypothetical protein
MRFMMLIKSDEQAETGAMPDDSLIKAMLDYNEELVNARALVAAEGLYPTSRGARVKFSKGKPVVTDGPFAEAKEVIAGYWLIEAKSRAAAIEWALRCPAVSQETLPAESNVGQLEIRQVFDLSEFPVNEEESGWREKEEQFRAEHQSPRFARPGWKQFMIIRMADRDSEAGVMPSEALLAEMGAYNDELVAAGTMISGEGLHPSSEGVRIEYRKGKRTLVDGPFTEAKELIAGFSIIEVKSKEEAIGLVKRWPSLDAYGEAEIAIREVFGAEDFGSGLSPELRAVQDRQRAKMGASH